VNTSEPRGSEAEVRHSTILGWRGQTIVGSRSLRSKGFWAHDWRDMVVDATGAITSKATAAGGARNWFSQGDFVALSKRDGRCSYLQSSRSEDTVTWTARRSR